MTFLTWYAIKEGNKEYLNIILALNLPSKQASNDSSTETSQAKIIAKTFVVTDLSRNMLSWLHEIFTLANISIKDLDALGILTGPNYFTTTRTILITAQTINFIHPHINVYACSNFLPLALAASYELAKSPEHSNIKATTILALIIKSPQNTNLIQYFKLQPIPSKLKPIATRTTSHYKNTSHFNTETATQFLRPLPKLIPSPLGTPYEITTTEPLKKLSANIQNQLQSLRSHPTEPINMVIKSDTSLNLAIHRLQKYHLLSNPTSTNERSATAKNKDFKIIELPSLPTAPTSLLKENLITLFYHEHLYNLFNLKTTYTTLRPVYIEPGYNH
ncbi:hypothetical protein COTS27_00202 [Spirochaetota bacterium]|nr:hypothetical protein COTS27_00202 [Spirochaetota bacterium]